LDRRRATREWVTEQAMLRSSPVPCPLSSQERRATANAKQAETGDPL